MPNILIFAVVTIISDVARVATGMSDARHDWSASYECPPKIMGDVPYDFGAAWMAGCFTKEKFMPERNVIGRMDCVGITVLEDAFDAKPMYDASDEATNRSPVSKAEAVLGPCAQHGAA